MPNASEVDVQAQAILTGLEALASLLENPLARDALDLAEKTGRAQTHAHYTLLRRLRKSLSQYLERHGNLFYIGLLGHFSSGKSSTINSLLGLWNTDNERATDLNPTDTTIWPAPGFTDTELGVLMEPEVCYGATEVYEGVQA